jgi:AcrR family transcriptional regulator
VPRTAGQNAQIREHRRRQILQAAVPLFARHGFSQTAIAEIAQAAGLSHGAVFLYYASKEDLFHAAVLEPLAALEAAFSLDDQTGGAIADVLRRMVHDHVAVVSRQGSYLRLMQYVLGQRDRFPELAAPLFAFVDRFCARLLPLIRAGQAAGALAPGDPHSIAEAYLSYLGSDNQWNEKSG